MRFEIQLLSEYGAGLISVSCLELIQRPSGDTLKPDLLQAVNYLLNHI